jgi:hypothetical protein
MSVIISVSGSESSTTSSPDLGFDAVDGALIFEMAFPFPLDFAPTELRSYLKKFTAITYLVVALMGRPSRLR